MNYHLKRKIMLFLRPLIPQAAFRDEFAPSQSSLIIAAEMIDYCRADDERLSIFVIVARPGAARVYWRMKPAFCLGHARGVRNTQIGIFPEFSCEW